MVASHLNSSSGRALGPAGHGTHGGDPSYIVELLRILAGKWLPRGPQGNHSTGSVSGMHGHSRPSATRSLSDQARPREKLFLEPVQ